MKYRRAHTRDIVGRRIAAVDWNRAYDRGRQSWTTQPYLYLDNGRRLSLSVEETDTGEYGIAIHLHIPEKAVTG